LSTSILLIIILCSDYMLIIAILNLQGAVSEHLEMSQKTIAKMGINAEVHTVRYSYEVSECDAIIISGGESTVIGKLIEERGIDKVIKDKKIPIFGTCAGMVLLSKKTDHDQPILGLRDIDVKRNAFGRQKDSFEQEIDILGDKFHGVFIRAPSVSNILVSQSNHSNLRDSEGIKILAKLGSNIIAVQQGYNIATSFHPELTNDTRLHEYFFNELLNR